MRSTQHEGVPVITWATLRHNTAQHNTTQHNTTPQHITSQHNTTHHNTTDACIAALFGFRVSQRISLPQTKAEAAVGCEAAQRHDVQLGVWLSLVNATANRANNNVIHVCCNNVTHVQQREQGESQLQSLSRRETAKKRLCVCVGGGVRSLTHVSYPAWQIHRP